MNYYQRHLGDYAKDTKHLSMAEHGAFNLLLDYYYATEKPIPDDRCERIAGAYANGEREIVRGVLEQFFFLTPEGWRNGKADEVISASRAKSLKAKESAEARWKREQCERNANASSAQCERNAIPLTNNHIEEAPKKAGAISLDTFLAQCAERGEQGIPEGDPVFAYAESIGLPAEYIALAWAWFKSSMGGKRQKNWRQHFRNAVSGNWPKYWYAVDGGGWALTTAGKQAQRAQA